MANTIKIDVDLEGQNALNTINALEKGFKGLGKTGTTEIKKMDAATSSFIGNLGALAAVKVFDFLKDQILNSVKAFTEFEDGIIAVAKTTNFSASEVEQFSKNIEKLTKSIPASSKELLGIAEAAGQLGVTGTKDVTKFTEVIAKLGRVSNLEGADAATVLTRILNVTREGAGGIETLSSVVVGLGNAFAATEADIAAITSEVARATAQFNVSSAEAAALGTTLRSVGVRSEEAGGVISKAFIGIDSAIRGGGKALQQLEQITGLTGEQIKKQFGEDATGLFRNFVAGLDTIQKSGGNVTGELEKLGISGIRVAKVFPTLAKNIGEFDRALGIANDQVKSATALQDEYEQILDKTSTKQVLFANAAENIGKVFFGTLAPSFNNVLDVMTAFLDKLSAGSPLEEAEANAKGLAATIKDVGDTTKTVNSFLPDFLANINSSFADDRIKRMNEELKITNAQVTSLSTDSTGLEKINADILLTTKSIADLNAQIADETITSSMFGVTSVTKTSSKETVKALEDTKIKLIELEAAKVKEIETSKIAAATAAEEAKVKAEAAAKDLANTKKNAEEKKTFLDELRAVEGEEEATRKEEALLAKQLESEEEFSFLETNLGREATIKELARIKDIKGEEKRKVALAKLHAKAEAQEKLGIINLEQFKDMTNAQRISAQKETLGAIAGLTSSNSGVLFNIGKAASLTMAGINVAEGVTKALAAFPPPFNFAAAGAVGAAGAISIANIAAAKKPSAGRFAEGGIVPGNSTSGDSLTANVNSGEMIFNKRQQKNLFDGVNAGGLGGGGGSITINNPMFLSEDGVDAVIDSINDRVEFSNKTLQTGT